MTETRHPDSCVGCQGRGGWYSPDNGQWVSCLHVQPPEHTKIELYEYDELPFAAWTGIRVGVTTVAVIRDRELAERVASSLERGPVVDPESLARRILETYERRAKEFGWMGTPLGWDGLKEEVRKLWTAICEELLQQPIVTAAQFQDMCHNVPPDDAKKFRRGCREYWRKIGLAEPRYATFYGEVWEFTEEKFMELLQAIRDGRQYELEQYGDRVSRGVEDLSKITKKRAGNLLALHNQVKNSTK